MATHPHAQNTFFVRIYELIQGDYNNLKTEQKELHFGLAKLTEGSDGGGGEKKKKLE